MCNRYFASGLFLSRMDKGERTWLLLKNSNRGDWGFPKGHRQKGESDMHCALRECAEETGIGLLEIHGDPFVLDYQVKGKGVKEVRYYPAETAIADVRISKEHSDAQWCSHQEVLKNLNQNSLKKLFKRYLAQEGLA